MTYNDIDWKTDDKHIHNEIFEFHWNIEFNRKFIWLRNELGFIFFFRWIPESGEKLDLSKFIGTYSFECLEFNFTHFSTQKMPKNIQKFSKKGNWRDHEIFSVHFTEWNCINLWNLIDMPYSTTLWFVIFMNGICHSQNNNNKKNCRNLCWFHIYAMKTCAGRMQFYKSW